MRLREPVHRDLKHGLPPIRHSAGCGPVTTSDMPLDLSIGTSGNTIAPRAKLETTGKERAAHQARASTLQAHQRLSAAVVYGRPRRGSSAPRRKLSSHYRAHSGKSLGATHKASLREETPGRLTVAKGTLPDPLIHPPPVSHARCRVVRQSITSLGSRPCGTSPTRYGVRSGSPRHAALVFMHQEEMDRWCRTPGALIYARPGPLVSACLYTRPRRARAPRWPLRMPDSSLDWTAAENLGKCARRNEKVPP